MTASNQWYIYTSSSGTVCVRACVYVFRFCWYTMNAHGNNLFTWRQQYTAIICSFINWICLCFCVCSQSIQMGWSFTELMMAQVSAPLTNSSAITSRTLIGFHADSQSSAPVPLPGWPSASHSLLPHPSYAPPTIRITALFPVVMTTVTTVLVMWILIQISAKTAFTCVIRTHIYVCLYVLYSEVDNTYVCRD